MSNINLYQPQEELIIFTKHDDYDYIEAIYPSLNKDKYTELLGRETEFGLNAITGDVVLRDYDGKYDVKYKTKKFKDVLDTYKAISYYDYLKGAYNVVKSIENKSNLENNYRTFIESNIREFDEIKYTDYIKSIELIENIGEVLDKYIDMNSDRVPLIEAYTKHIEERDYKPVFIEIIKANLHNEPTTTI